MSVFIKGVTKSQLMKVIINSIEFMPDNFEVIEVKTPHGALIDRDALMDEMKPRWDCMDNHDFADKGVWQALAITPIVVEAEVE